MVDFIERLRAKPEHVRKQIALGTSAGVTGIVALGWIGAFVATGPLTLAEPATGSFANAAPALEEPRSSFSQLFAAVGAAGQSSDEGELTIIDAHTSTTVDPEPVTDNRTVIPF